MLLLYVWSQCAGAWAMWMLLCVRRRDHRFITKPQRLPWLFLYFYTFVCRYPSGRGSTIPWWSAWTTKRGPPGTRWCTTQWGVYFCSHDANATFTAPLQHWVVPKGSFMEVSLGVEATGVYKNSTFLKGWQLGPARWGCLVLFILDKQPLCVRDCPGTWKKIIDRHHLDKLGGTCKHGWSLPGRWK